MFSENIFLGQLNQAVKTDISKRLGQKSKPLNCLWIVEQDAVVEWALLR
ncbi:hypothetical protein HMPREF9422_1262 [Streptococcus cristatus ATCC 51100]|uniref:Conserved domain protein n=1 Tax=Streptococcus cristatus ATCC 51100 TaxID=889201 RepID=A0AAV3ECV2_STRCR|nr:hypothetical protein HMPREF9422_1262 [Streptococcus cristatus ATCC 51100]EGU66471.1 conserved domain protein [Streptococcus cristatus ATCC 51100]